MTNIESLVPDGFSGCVSVSRDGSIVFRKAFGYADKANERLNTVDTRFATASAGKFFVAIAVMRLVEEGRLGLEDPIGSILRFDLRAIDPGVTIRQLLTHTSGVPDYFDESVMDEYADLWVDFPCYRIRRSADLLPLFVDKPMMYPAGQRFQYNNSGFVLLDLAIEAVTGAPFDRFLSQAVFDPAGMSSTGYYETDRLPSRCANAYIYDEEREEYYTNIFSVDAKGTGAGGAFTTAPDVSSLWRALLSGGLLPTARVEELLTARIEAEDEFYGYGVWLAKRNGALVPYFQGCDPGVSFISSLERSRGLEITIESNQCDDVWALERSIYEAMAGR